MEIINKSLTAAFMSAAAIVVPTVTAVAAFNIAATIPSIPVEHGVIVGGVSAICGAFGIASMGLQIERDRKFIQDITGRSPRKAQPRSGLRK